MTPESLLLLFTQENKIIFLSTIQLKLSDWLNTATIFFLSSVTRFDENSPLLQNLKRLGYFLREYLAKLLTHFVNIWLLFANLDCCKWPNIDKKSSHLVTLFPPLFAQQVNSGSQLPYFADKLTLSVISLVKALFTQYTVHWIHKKLPNSLVLETHVSGPDPIKIF